MLRAVLLSIVLMITAGQNAALLCTMVCGSNAGPTGCQHEVARATPIVTGDAGCGTVVLTGTAVVRNEELRGAADQMLRAAFVEPPYLVPPPATTSDRASDRWGWSPITVQPLVIALRI